ncbi:MAG TPA: hypothetical protein PKD99_10755 [Sphingopyxis sp.]|nr:hypothetical protein [Sphingopyxis sp.]HMP45575.1 hypothetical protein [Sphingopyxis sp.]HMQ18419.1 hypothetical protein [Sphingopyxis sp.]
MRALLIPSVLVAAFAATPAAADGGCPASSPPAPASIPLVPLPPENPTEPSRLAPLAADSPWRARFEAAADELLPALRSGDWQPLLGGRWLGEADRQAVADLLADRCAAFAPLLAASGPVERRIFGWSLPASYSAAARAEIASRPEAEALVCWSAERGDLAWPRTAAEADNGAGRPWACARIAYSLRGGTPGWRAFIERG